VALISYLSRMRKNIEEKQETNATCATKHLSWRVHHGDSSTLHFYGDPTGLDEVLALHPNATHAEPFAWPVSVPDLALAPDEIALIAEWLTAIDALNDLPLVLDRCATSMTLRQQWLDLAHNFRNSK
jgi:hypothetical protein